MISKYINYKDLGAMLKKFRIFTRKLLIVPHLETVSEISSLMACLEKLLFEEV